MGCFELSALFPKGHSDKERNNASSSGECSSAKGGTGTTNSGTYSQINSGSYVQNSSVADSGSYVASDPNISVEVAVDSAAEGAGVIDTLGTKLLQSGSLRKPNELRDFTYHELRYATKNFDRKNLLGEGGFGQVFKGTIKQKQRFGGGEEKVDVAVKQLNSRSQQGHKEWLAEVHFLGLVDCAFLVKLIGYCATDDDERGIQRLLVYEFMPNKGLDDHLFRLGPNCLSWASRVKIVLGAARGLAYLHEELEIQIIFRDFKTSNVLLDEDFNPKLSDFGLARQGPQDGDSHVSTAVVGTAGYAAPEYIQTGHLTVKSDVWSFGIVMLEVLTGRKVMDRNRPKNEQRLVEWAKPYISDHHKIFQIVDPLLKGRYPARPAQKFAQLAYQCLSKFPKHRPKMSDIVDKLKIVQEKTYQWESPSSHSPSSLSLSGEFARRDSPRGLTLGSLPTVRSGKASKYGPGVRNSADESRQMPSLSLEGSSHGSSQGSGHATIPVSTSGSEPKPVDSEPKPPRANHVEKPELGAPVLEKAEPVDLSVMKPEPVDASIKKPEPVDASIEKPEPVDASINKPEPVDASIEKPEPVDVSINKPEPVDASINKPKPVDASIEKPEPVEPKPVHLSVENPELVEESKSSETIAQKPKPTENPERMNSSAEKPELVETVVEEPKLVETFVEELKLVDMVVQDKQLEPEPKLVDTVVEEPRLADQAVVENMQLDLKPKLVDRAVEEPRLVDRAVEEPKLVDRVVEEPRLVDAVVEDKQLDPKPKLVDRDVEEARVVDTVVEEKQLDPKSKLAEEKPECEAEIPKPMHTGGKEPGLSREGEVVKRRVWGSDRLARMGRQSGRFTWIPKLSFSTSSNRSTS